MENFGTHHLKEGLGVLFNLPQSSAQICLWLLSLLSRQVGAPAPHGYTCRPKNLVLSECIKRFKTAACFQGGF